MLKHGSLLCANSISVLVGCHLVNGFAANIPAILSENFGLQNWKHQQRLFIFMSKFCSVVNILTSE